MRLGIKGKQVLGVTSIVGAVVVLLSLLYLAGLARVSLEESRARAQFIADAIYHRAREVVVTGAPPYQALGADPGLRSVLVSSLYSKNVIFAAIVDVNRTAVVHTDPVLEGQTLPVGGDLAATVSRSALSQLVAIYSGQGRNLEYREPLRLGDTDFGSICIGVSTLLVRQDLDASLGPAVATAGAALAVSVIVSMLFAQLLLRPIHVIRGGLTRLSQGELGVRLDLDQRDEFGELGDFFNTVSAQLSADRSQMAGQVANLESAVQHLEDAVAIVNPGGELLFANPAMRALLPDLATGASLGAVLGADHPLRTLWEQTLVSRVSPGAPERGSVENERLAASAHTVHDINRPISTADPKNRFITSSPSHEAVRGVLKRRDNSLFKRARVSTFDHLLRPLFSENAIAPKIASLPLHPVLRPPGRPDRQTPNERRSSSCLTHRFYPSAQTFVLFLLTARAC